MKIKTFKDEVKESVVNFLFRHKNDDIPIFIDFYYMVFGVSFFNTILQELQGIIHVNENKISLRDLD